MFWPRRESENSAVANRRARFNSRLAERDCPLDDATLAGCRAFCPLRERLRIGSIRTRKTTTGNKVLEATGVTHYALRNSGYARHLKSSVRAISSLCDCTFFTELLSASVSLYPSLSLCLSAYLELSVCLIFYTCLFLSLMLLSASRSLYRHLRLYFSLYFSFVP